MLKIFIDGSGDMPEGWEEKYQYEIIPIPIQFGEKTYYQGVDIKPDQFYELVSDEINHPKTAAPSPSMIKALIEKKCNEGDTALSINVSGKMSATVQMVQQAAEELKNRINVIPFDSYAGSAVLALMAREARLWDGAGETLDHILEKLRVMREKLMIVLTIDSLDFAYRSGRVGKLQAAISSILKIKPIVTLKEGLLSVSEVVRTRSKSIERIVAKVHDQFGEEAIKVAVVHSQDQPTAEILHKLVVNTVNVTEAIFTELSISVAANLGPKTVGIVAYPDKI
ncbi:MAG: DegV family protein [Chloroflexi bacterium]|nr:DegV family protein [Chloroflexota bacterium]